MDAAKGYVVTNFHVIKDARADYLVRSRSAPVSGEAGGNGILAPILHC